MINFKVEEYTKQVKNGDINPLGLFSELNELEKAIKEAKKEIQEDAINEFNKHGEKTLKKDGYEISCSSSGRYSYIHNSDWLDLDTRRKELESKMQNAYKANGSIIDETTGELIEPASYKPNAESLRFKKIK